jgi:hypothetical protein
MVRWSSCWFLPVALIPLGCGNGDSSKASRQRAPATQSATTQSAITSGGGGGGKTTQAPEERLYGTWIASDVDAKLGQVTVKLTFRRQGPVHIAAWSDIPLVGQVRNKTAPYEVHGYEIHSDAIRGGTTVKYWFEGDQLVIQYKQGKTVHFHRQA